MTGFRKSITHLDGRSVRVMYGKGVRDGEVLRIDNEGMPKGDGRVQAGQERRAKF